MGCTGCDYSSHSDCEHIKKLKADMLLEIRMQIDNLTCCRGDLDCAKPHEECCECDEYVVDYKDVMKVLEDKKNGM